MQEPQGREESAARQVAPASENPRIPENVQSFFKVGHIFDIQGIPMRLKKITKKDVTFRILKEE